MKKSIEKLLKKAVRECCTNADCYKLAKIFESVDWRWVDRVTDEMYIPNERDIRNALFTIGTDALNTLIKDYDNGRWDDTNPKSYILESGRLFFSIEWEHFNRDTKFRFVEDISISCGLNQSFCDCTIEKLEDTNAYSIESYADGDDEPTMVLVDYSELEK